MRCRYAYLTVEYLQVICEGLEQLREEAVRPRIRGDVTIHVLYCEVS